MGKSTLGGNATEEAVLRRNAAENLYLTGKEAERMGDTATALSAYTQAWKFDSTSEFLTDYAAQFALVAGKPGQAIYIMSAGETAETLSDEKLRFMAGVYIRYREYRDALLLYTKLDTLNGSDSLVYANLLAETGGFMEAAGVLNSMAPSLSNRIKVADLYRRAGKLDSAYTMFAELNQVLPEDRMVSKGLGLTLLAQNREQDALVYLKQFLPFNDNTQDNQVVELLGRYYASLGRFDEAVALFKTLYTYDSTPADYYYGRPLAIYAFLAKRFQYAETIMLRLLQDNDEDAELQYLLGAVYESMGNPQKALDQYSISLSKDSTLDDAIQARILLNARLGNEDQAISHAITFTQQFPYKIDAWGLYGSLLTMHQRFNEAIIPLERAVELSGDTISSAILFELGMSYERIGETRKSEKLFKRLLAMDSTHAPAANYLGYMWADRGVKLDEARKLIETALTYDPENGAYLDSYGWVLYQLGEYDLALEKLNEALSHIKDDYVIYFHLAFVLEKLGRYDEALKRFQEAAEFQSEDLPVIKEQINLLKPNTEVIK